ncbi:MarR family transcriptional regulator [Actinoplanes sp. NPDC051851]|uniref:MarR family winged helix-turn-helix transcriptional regulator n=1 Tax=Actinoplanes sp. NPDC051851 TaxID=3154753 RepID=UPI003416DE4E
MGAFTETGDHLATLRLAGLLKGAQRLLVDAYEPALAPFNVDGRELAVLTLLTVIGAVSQQEISRRLGIDRTTIVALTDTMSEKGLLLRLPDPRDRRKNLIELTPAGRDLHARAAPAIDEVEAAFLAPLAAEDRDKLRELLRAVVASR